MYSSGEPFWDRTMRLIRDIWPLGDREELKDKLSSDLQDSDIAVLQDAIDTCLDGKGGEVSARTRAAELGRAYLTLSLEGRKKFLELLATEYDVDNVAVEKNIDSRKDISSPLDLQAANHQLRLLLDPPRTRLLSQFNGLNEGVKFLVDLRADLLEFKRDNILLKALDIDVHRLLASWFDIGFLDLRRITWDTQASILEKLIQYESVHAISSWKDLKNRLRPDRRCYGFFHPKMEDEPLIFVEVALVNGIADNVQSLLDVEAPVQDPEKMDTAIFYSISNCQKGLAGVSFGNFLIKRVVADLVGKMPNLKCFSTLSPIPGFLNWLLTIETEITEGTPQAELWNRIRSAEDPGSLLKEMLEDREGGEDKKILQELLPGFCAIYLVEAKRGMLAYDRVAHFHLTNGARIERINWGANMTAAGISQSAGLMVNYLYDLSQIEKNHELYTGKGEISVSSAVRKLLK